MAYNDMRSVTVDGEEIPVGHPYYASSDAKTSTSNTITFNLELCDTTASVQPGAIVITCFTTAGYPTDIIVPIRGTKVVGTMSGSTQKIYQRQIGSSVKCTAAYYRSTSSTSAPITAYSFTLSASAYAQIKVFGSNVKITPFSIPSEGAVTQTSLTVYDSKLLQSGVDYGTVAQRDALTHKAGQIFYVEI